MCIVGVFCVHAHKSIHDEYMAANNNVTTSPQTYLNHPFETRKDANVSRRMLSAKWEPLRIHVDTSDLADPTRYNVMDAASQKILRRFTSVIIPQAIKILTKHLHVIRVNGNLKITPRCYLLMNGGASFTSNACCEEKRNPHCHWINHPSCGVVRIPDSHKTTGVPDADFVLYLTANNETSKVNALAWGSNCRVDQHDRPLAGQIAFDLNTLLKYATSASNNYLVALVAHELSHALGWSSYSFSKFRDEYGNIRRNVFTFQSTLGKRIALLSTPAATKYVREHFGCDSLAGMELEDGNGFVPGSHPEKRIFPESYMGAVIQDNQTSYLIDAMALSVFQDSGWYQVKHLDQAARLSWGRGMGCRVATHKCDDYGPEANEKGLFCEVNTQHYCVGNRKQAVGKCGMKRFSYILPRQFQYFSDTHMGGWLKHADYCPRPEEDRRGDCTDPNMLWIKKHMGSQAGAESRCFMSTLKAGTRKALARPHGSCYRRSCKADALQIHVGSYTVSCPLSNTATTVTVPGYNGELVCPPYSGLGDIRCVAICSTEDPECLGLKGSVVERQTVKSRESGLVKALSKALPKGDKPVVVHGRLRH